MTSKTIMIVGLGLIGSSLAKCIKIDHPDTQVIGWDYSDSTKLIAKKIGIVDEIPHSFEEGAKLADVIILATPVSISIDYLNQLASLPLKENV